MENFLETVFYTTISLHYLVLSWGHITRSFLILVITVIWEDSITIFRVLISHLFHSSMVWEQIFLSNGSLLKFLSAFCEYAVAVDLFGLCLQRKNKEFIHQNFQSSVISALRHCIFGSQATEWNIFHRSKCYSIIIQRQSDHILARKWQVHAIK